jgi:hypothetical protein
MALGYKLFGSLIGIVLIIWAVSYYWVRPEVWNPTAGQYKTERDSLRKELPVLVRLNATKDSVIADIAGRWQQAIAYGDKWKADLNAQYAISDNYAARLTKAQQEHANYVGLQQNGTLDKGIDPATLTPGDGRVVLANLQTVQREAIGAKSLDSVGRVIGVLTTKTERMGGTLKRVGPKLGTVSTTLKVAAKKARFLFFETKQSKRLKQAASAVDSIKADVQKESQLEEVLNRKP